MNFFLQTAIEIFRDAWFNAIGEALREQELFAEFENEKRIEKTIESIKISIYRDRLVFNSLKEKHPELTFLTCLSIGRADLVQDIRDIYRVAKEKRLKKQKQEENGQKIGGVIVYIFTLAGIGFLGYIVYHILKGIFFGE